MKTIRFYAALIFIASLLAVSCDREDDLFMTDERGTPEALRQKTELTESRTVFLTPSGAEFDTQNFLAAIEQSKGFGPRVEINLSEGIFYFDKIDIYDFNGTIKGAGREKTIIKSLPGGINLPVYEPTKEVKPYFISFYGGNLIMKDLSFVIDEDQPVKPYEHWSGEGYLTIMGTIIWINGHDPDHFNATSCFTNVGFTGKMVNLYNYSPYNTDCCIFYGGSFDGRPLKGDHIIQNCDFNITESAILSMGGINSTVIFGGSPARGNTLKDVNGGVFIMDGDNMTYILSHNKITDTRSYAGIWISQNPSNYFSPYIKPGKSRFYIQSNEIRIIGSPYGDGVSMQDLAGLADPAKKSSYLVSNNHFTLTGESQSAVFSYGSFNANVTKNKIEGISEHAIGLWGQTSDWKVVMNKFNNYECTWYDIVLGPLTHDNMVVGNNQTTILDISENNEILNPGSNMQIHRKSMSQPRPMSLKYKKNIQLEE